MVRKKFATNRYNRVALIRLMWWDSLIPNYNSNGRVLARIYLTGSQTLQTKPNSTWLYHTPHLYMRQRKVPLQSAPVLIHSICTHKSRPTLYLANRSACIDESVLKISIRYLLVHLIHLHFVDAALSLTKILIQVRPFLSPLLHFIFSTSIAPIVCLPPAILQISKSMHFTQ